MKKLALVLVAVILFTVTGCEDHIKKNQFLPEANNDKTYTTISGGEETHQGDGYIISVPEKNYRYDKDYDDGVLEEKWDYKRKDDVEIKVTTYKNMDEVTARGRFLRENDDYIFEDLTSYPLCGQEFDGDALWFNLHVSGETVYIVSCEYPKNTKEELKTELLNVVNTFKLTQ